MCDFQFNSLQTELITLLWHNNNKLHILQIEINIISEDSNLACQHDEGGREPIMIKDLGKKYVNTKENTWYSKPY